MMETIDRHLVTTPEVFGGKPRVRHRRITVQNIVVWHEHLRRTPDEICAEHDLTLAEVHAALAYYFDHQEEIDATIRASKEFVAAQRARSVSKLPQLRKTA